MLRYSSTIKGRLNTFVHKNSNRIVISVQDTLYNIIQDITLSDREVMLEVLTIAIHSRLDFLVEFIKSNVELPC